MGCVGTAAGIRWLLSTHKLGYSSRSTWITELLKLEKIFKTMKSNLWPNTTVSTKAEHWASFQSLINCTYISHLEITIKAGLDCFELGQSTSESWIHPDISQGSCYSMFLGVLDFKSGFICSSVQYLSPLFNMNTRKCMLCNLNQGLWCSLLSLI